MAVRGSDNVQKIVVHAVHCMRSDKPRLEVFVGNTSQKLQIRSHALTNTDNTTKIHIIIIHLYDTQTMVN